MQYAVKIVGDDELPDGVHIVIVERDSGPPVMLLSGQPARCWQVAREWEDLHEPCTVPTVLLPAQPFLLRAI